MAEQKTIDFIEARPELKVALDAKGYDYDKFETIMNDHKTSLDVLSSDNQATNQDLIFLLIKSLIKIDDLETRVQTLESV